jgi:hypothetical protein
LYNFFIAKKLGAQMYYVKFDSAGNVVNVIAHSQWKELSNEEKNNFQCRWDWKSFADVERIAALLTKFTGNTWLPCDKECTFPQFDVVEAPKVGDAVSSSFNGDTRPRGYVTKVTSKFQVNTSTGHKFRRDRSTASWKMCNGYEYLVPGHIETTNPHF